MHYEYGQRVIKDTKVNSVDMAMNTDTTTNSVRSMPQGDATVMRTETRLAKVIQIPEREATNTSHVKQNGEK